MSSRVLSIGVSRDTFMSENFYDDRSFTLVISLVFSMELHSILSLLCPLFGVLLDVIAWKGLFLKD